KWHEDFLGAGLQEQRVGMNEHRSGFSGGPDYLFQLNRHVGYAGQHRSDIDPSADTRLSQLLNRLQAQVGAGSARLQNAGQISIGRGHGDVDGNEVVFGNALQHFQVTQNQV